MAKKKKWYTITWGIIFILCFWPFIVSYYLIKVILKNSNGSNSNRTIPNTQADSYVAMPMTDREGKPLIEGMPYTSKDSTHETKIGGHLKTLADFYKNQVSKYPDEKNVPEKIVRTLFPKADSHTCPYCGVVHEFQASRARKCPECGKTMVVRFGKFLTEQQVGEVESKTRDYYTNIGFVNQLKNSIEMAQSNLKSLNYGDAYLSIAEAYQACAIVQNKKDSSGFSYWDYSWGILNKEVLEFPAKVSSNPKELINNGYADVLFARGMHCMRLLRTQKDASAAAKPALQAIQIFYGLLVDTQALNLSSWKYDAAIKNIHIARILGNISQANLSDIKSNVNENSTLKPGSQITQAVIDEVENYVFLETDPVKLRMSIY